MISPLPPLDFCVLLLLQETYDPNGKHMEFKDREGAVFARMAKVYKKNAFVALFDVFLPAQDIHGELRDTQKNLLLTTTSHYGGTRRECRMDIHLPDGTLWGRVYDAAYGADFALPDDTIIGNARRPDDHTTEPSEVVYTFRDAAEQAVGTYQRTFPDQSHSLWNFLENGGINSTGQALQIVTVEPDAEPMLRNFALLLPALQYMRYIRPANLA